MDREKALDSATVYLGGYVKRWMETNYDRLMATGVGQAAHSLDQRTRYAIEAGLYGLLVAMNRGLPDATPVERLVKEVALDAPSEIAKRLVNGAADVTTTHRDEHTTSPVQRLLGVDESVLSEFLTWFNNLDSSARESALTIFGQFDSGELLAFAELAPATRNAYLQATAPPPESNTRTKPSPLHGLRAAMEAHLGDSDGAVADE